jgi:hypothetical protein
VDLDRIEQDLVQSLALQVTNPGDVAAHISIVRADGVALSLPAATISPGASRTYTMPIDRLLDGSGIFEAHAWRIETDVPVVIQAINPQRIDGIFSIDGSLLVPTHSLGLSYTSVSWPHRMIDEIFSQTHLRGFVTVVATAEGTTDVTVSPTVAVAAGPNLAAMVAGSTRVVQLARGQVLNLETHETDGDDLTGTTITASAPVAVFGGHECANVPNVDTGYCDHLEEQLLPTTAWGEGYAVVPFSPRSQAQVDVIKVTAGSEAVTLVAVPPQLFGVTTVAAGDTVSLDVAEAFLLTADAPFQVAHYLAGSNHTGYEVDPLCGADEAQTGIGDPAMKMVVSVSHFSDDATISVPEGFRENYLEIVHFEGGEVMVDGVAISGFTAIAGTGLLYKRLALNAGTYRVTGSLPFGLAAYGYDCDVSYAHPGAFSLTSSN